MQHRFVGLVLGGLAVASVASASVYQLGRHNVSASGGAGASATFRASWSAGEAVVGGMSSAHFVVGAGQFMTSPPVTSGVGSPAPTVITRSQLVVRSASDGGAGFQLDLVTPSEARLSVYDLRGRLVRTLVAGSMSAGHHEVTWDGTSDSGRRQARGIYFVRVEAGAFVDHARVVLLK